MNNTMSLAIVEKKPQRPGGCVGIFFRLFDWNQRFSRKNMFSKKFLPPVRFKQTSKKFGGDEKQPKLRLIADENNGGFPNAKISNGANSVENEQKHEMRVPGIVARLMGLESMPTLQRYKMKKKVPASGIVCGKAEVKKEELNAEKSGSIKHEVRPQKLQKTIICERQPITRFGAEKLPFKNVLSKSSKHHPKLPSPVKSPKNLARKRSSKLIGAATRILEPGLQTNRSKCALTYSNTVRNSPKEPNVEDSCGFVSVGAEGESSCRNCGYLLDNLNGECAIGSKPLVFASPFSNHVRPSSCKPVNTPGYLELDDYIERHLCSQQLKPPKGMPLPLGDNQMSYRQNQMSRVRETVPPRLNATNMMNHKASASMNRNQSLSYSTRSRLPSRMENGRFELEKRINTSMNESVPPGRKRRPTYISRQDENSGCLSTTINKPVVGSPRSVSRKQLGHDAHYCRHECDRVGLLSGPGNSNGVSFTFNSSVKQKNGIREVSETRVRSGLYSDEGEEPALGENDRKMKFEKLPPISGDALGALLEQKLKELGQRDDAGNAPRKTTSLILEELITALTSVVPLQQDNLPPISDRKSGWSDQSHLSNPKPSPVSQVTFTRGNAMGVKPSFDQPIDSEHLSPGSVLEPFFSTESCPSSSADDSLGCKTVDENLDCSYSDLLDCAASLNAIDNTKDVIGEIIKNVSEILRCSGVAFSLKENELNQVEKVLLNAELAFHSSMPSSSAVGRGSPIKHLLLDELDMLASVLWMNFGCSLGIEDGKEVNQLKRFVLDSVMEYLGIRFKEYLEYGLRKFRIRMSNSMLIVEIVEVVRRWERKSRLDVDELIEREMDDSLGEWTRCENEGIECGIEISRYLLQILVDEIVMDLCCC